MSQKAFRHPIFWGAACAALSVLCFCIWNGGDPALLLAGLALHVALAFALGCWGSRKLSRRPEILLPAASLPRPVRIAVALFALGCCTLLVKNCFFLHPYTRQGGSLLSTLQEVLPLSPGQVQDALVALGILCGLLAGPLVYTVSIVAYAWAMPRLRGFLRSLSRFERWAVLAFVLLAAALILYSARHNPIFIHSLHADGSVSYRGVFSAESAAITHHEILGSPLFDDARHPLMGLICLPFALTGWLLAGLGYVVTGLRYDFYLFYGVALSLLQALVIAAGALVLKRMLQRRTSPRFAGGVMLVFLCSFPALIFAVVVERYAYAFLFLLLFVYALVERRSLRAVCLSFLCAAGTLSTSTALLPFFLWAFRREGRFQWKKLGQFCLAVLALCLCTGRLPILLGFFDSSHGFLWKFAQPFQAENAQQFLIFLRGVLLMPPFHIPWIVIDQLPMAEVGLLPKITGGVVAAVSLLGLVMARKQLLAWVSAYWTVFCAVLLMGVGLGAAENAMALYALYYSWAFLVLMAFAAWPLARRFPRASCVLLVAGCACLLWYNLSGWWGIVHPLIGHTTLR